MIQKIVKSVSFTSEIINDIEKIAIKENRSFSNATRFLLNLAIKEYWKKKG
jgi:hypothetical protein